MLQWIKVIASIAYDRPMRCRLIGMRPVVVCIIQATEDNAFLFVAPSQKPDAWMPPQEGIEPNESIEKAIVRGLDAELGISENDMHFRRSVWIGSKSIPEQHGERDIRYSLVKMRGKAYYAALVKVSRETTLRLNPAEIARSEWFGVEQIAPQLSTNSERKQWVIREAFQKLLSLDLTSNK